MRVKRTYEEEEEEEMGVGWVLEAVAACWCLNLAGTLVASDLRSWEEREEEEKAAKLVVGDSNPPTAAAGRRSNSFHPL